MYKLVFSDLDETLLVNHHVPLFNIEAIKEVEKLGVKFIPCTGRAFYMIGDINDELGLSDKEGTYSVCFNGGAIVENKSKEVIYFQGIDYSIVEEMAKINEEYNFCMLIFTTEKCYLYKATESEIKRKTNQGCPIELIDDIRLVKDKKIAKCNFQSDDPQILLDIKDKIIDQFKDKGTVTLSSSRYIEINALNVDKGQGLKRLASYLGVDIADTIAIGDNYNDIEMLKMAGVGACVSSSHQDIKDISDYVCFNDYDQGAVKEVLEKFIIKGEANNV